MNNPFPGSARSRGIAVSLLGTALILAATGCTRSESSINSSSSQLVSCDDVAASVIQRERVGDTAGVINSEIQWLSENCGDEYDIAIDYLSTASMAKGQFGPETCDFLLERNIHPESVRLLRAEELCTDSSSDNPWTDTSPQTQWPNDGLSWDQAVNHVGTTQRVCGPLMSMRTSNDDVFLNIGLDYPDPQRFAIVVWDIGGVELESPGLTICANGPITSYNGVAQIELRDLGPVEVWD